MKAYFGHKGSGLEVSFFDLSEVSGSYTRSWDFGVENGTSTDKNPLFTYPTLGIYDVSLTITEVPEDPLVTPEVRVYSEKITVSDQVKTMLSGSIYDLVNNLLPDNSYINPQVKAMLIEKWQYYIGPLVNHDIPLEEYTNELYYEALENQLIMELTAYESLIISVNLMTQGLAEKSQSQSQSSGSSSSGGGSIRKIVTGPSEVEFASSSSSEDASAVANTVKAQNGYLQTLIGTICMLAQRVDIYLPICGTMASMTTKVPQVVNKRIPGPLGGPNPLFPLKK